MHISGIINLSKKIIFPGFVFFIVSGISLAVNTVESMVESDEWIEIKPGAGTICARGEDYSFFVSPGTSDKVVIDFMGGGACWDETSCAKESATFSDSINDLRRRQRKGLKGVYNRSRSDNPLGEWTHVVVPYCTGDIHWGNNTQTYTKSDGSSFAINHKGAVNTKAVLDWVESNIIQPEKVLVTGCSAGSYGSIYWSPAIKKMFPDSSFYQFGDSGTGVITKEFFRKSFPRWNPTANAPTWIPELDPEKVDWTNLTLVDFYHSIASFHPNTRFSQFTSAYDDIQTFFYELMGGRSELWSNKMLVSLDKIENSTPNYNSFVAPGSDHCILPYDEIYTKQSAGQSFKHWFEGFLDDENVSSVMCEDCDPDGVGS